MNNVIKYYLTDSTKKEIKNSCARWWSDGQSFINIYTYNIKDAKSWTSLENLTSEIDLMKDNYWDLSPVLFENDKFVKVIEDEELWPERFKKS